VYFVDVIGLSLIMVIKICVTLLCCFSVIFVFIFLVVSLFGCQ